MIPGKSRHAAYRNVKSKKIEIDGIKFASPGEAERYLELCIMKMEGQITEIVLQPVFELQPAFRKCCGRIWLQIDGNYEVNKKGICPVCGEKMMRMFFRSDMYIKMKCSRCGCKVESVDPSKHEALIRKEEMEGLRKTVREPEKPKD